MDVKDGSGRLSPGVIAFFITSHGFGHAARAAAVMGALGRRMDGVRFEIFTAVPGWFFRDSVRGSFGLWETFTDIGFVQNGPFEEDIERTLDVLDEKLPFEPARVKSLTERLKKTNCRMVICDIAPLGILAARHAGIPSVLLENFTWDRIYRDYEREWRRFEPHAQYLADICKMANYHVQARPVVSPDPGCDLTVSPVARTPRTSRDTTRERLGVSSGEKCVLVTTGGISGRMDFLDQFSGDSGILFVVPGGADRVLRLESLLLLPKQSRFYHPDLVAAADAVIGKVGYSTLAETYRSGVPFGYIPRKRFPESPALERFIRQEMSGERIEPEDFLAGRWIDQARRLCVLPISAPKEENGADQLARWIQAHPAIR